VRRGAHPMTASKNQASGLENAASRLELDRASAAPPPLGLPPPASGGRDLFQPFALPSGQFSGDTFPVFRHGVCHLFHMMPPVIAHHVSRDLVHWGPRPVAVAPGRDGEPDSGNNATGCVVEHEDRFYLFYTGNQNVCLATSEDLDRWTKHAGNPVAQGDNALYETANFRDPYVFYHGPERRWWMLFGSRTTDRIGQRAGCVGLAKSKDLFHWELCPPLWAPGIGPHCDCPQLIRRAKHWILFYLQRNTRYRIGASPAGPFGRPPNRNLGTPLANAGSRPAFDGRRWISFPFVSRLKGESDWGDWEYGGPLAIPRHLEIRADGTVAERPAAEILEAIRSRPDPGDPFRDAVRVAGRWRLGKNRSGICRSPSGGTLLLPALPPDLYMEFEMTLPGRDSDFHLLLRTTPDLLNGYQLSLHPRTSQASLRPLSTWDVDRVLASRSLAIPHGRPLAVRVFLSGSVLEVFFGDRASLTARLYQRRQGLAALEFRDGTGSVRNLLWRPLGGGG
jgi:beta-fructofuranosidase